jgi:hypothetical protein
MTAQPQPDLLASAYRPDGVRDDLDRYYTPAALARFLVGLLPITIGSRVLEPSVGGGAFLRAVEEVAIEPDLRAIDIDPGAAGLRLAHRSWVGDFLTHDDCTHGVDWVIGNPPYNEAEAHIRRALAVGRDVAFLLRLGILASAGRAPMWKQHPPRRVFVLAERPSFTGGGTDKYDYAWIWWDATWTGPTELDVVSWRGAA